MLHILPLLGESATLPGGLPAAIVVDRQHLLRSRVFLASCPGQARS